MSVPLFSYTAVDAHGNLVHGALSGSKPDVLGLARQKGLTLIRCKQIRPNFWPFGRPVLNSAVFFEQLALLLKQQISIPEALNLIALTLPLPVQDLLLALKERLYQGLPLSEILEPLKLPQSAFVLSALKSAEKTGRLGPICELLSSFYKMQENFQKQRRKALTYPIMVGGTLLGVLMILLRILVPNLRFLIETPQTLSQRLIFALSECALNAPLTLICLGLLAGGALSFFVKFLAKKVKQHEISYEQLLLLNTFVILLKAHISLKETLELMERHAPKYTQSKIRMVLQRMLQGRPFHEALAEGTLFPSRIIKFAELGEASGTLDLLLEQCADFEQQRFQERSQRRLALIQPILLSLLGGILLWIILTMFLPLYDNISVL